MLQNNLLPNLHAIISKVKYSPKKTPFRVTKFHYTDLLCAAANNKSCIRIFNRLKVLHGFEIDEQPVPGIFYSDLSVCFLYPYQVQIMPDIDVIKQERKFFIKNVTDNKVWENYSSTDYGEIAELAFKFNMETFGDPEFAVSYADGTLVKRKQFKI